MGEEGCWERGKGRKEGMRVLTFVVLCGNITRGGGFMRLLREGNGSGKG
jgi:hypothetical protein